MTERERRLKRLVQLRTNQHDFVAAQLRAALAVLHQADLALEQCILRGKEARVIAEESLTQNDQQSWLMASADIELSRLTTNTDERRRLASMATVESLRAQEAEARLARKQMERSLEIATTDAITRALRMEQRQLDEMTRVLRGSSLCNPRSSRFR